MGGAGRGPPEPVKAVRDGAVALTSAAMERPHFPLAMGLALLAFCLLTLSPDARAELRSRSRMTGERQNLSPNDPRAQKAAQAAVSSYNMGSNSLYYFRDTKIVGASYQVWWLWDTVAVERDKDRERDRPESRWPATKHKRALSQS